MLLEHAHVVWRSQLRASFGSSESVSIKYGTGGGGKMLLWRMISSWRAKPSRVGAEIDPYRETPPLALDPSRKPPFASERVLKKKPARHRGVASHISGSFGGCRCAPARPRVGCDDAQSLCRAVPDRPRRRSGTPRCRSEKSHRRTVNAISCHRLADQTPTMSRTDNGARMTKSTAYLRKHWCPRQDSNLRHRL
jgi:hypothetical protein